MKRLPVRGHSVPQRSGTVPAGPRFGGEPILSSALPDPQHAHRFPSAPAPPALSAQVDDYSLKVFRSETLLEADISNFYSEAAALAPMTPRWPRADRRCRRRCPPSCPWSFTPKRSSTGIAEFDRQATSVTHMRHIDRVQDHSPSTGGTDVSRRLLRSPIRRKAGVVCHRFAAEGRALIGAHLHPWVSPPYTEEVSQRNSFPGNLPRDLEHEKLARLTERIAANFGTRPMVYLPRPLRERSQQRADSRRPRLRSRRERERADGLQRRDGPDYSVYTNHPFWFGNRRQLLGLCYSGAFVGGYRREASGLSFHTRPRFSWTRMPGVLSRLRAVDRIGLSPEGYTNAELRR